MGARQWIHVERDATQCPEPVGRSGGKDVHGGGGGPVWVVVGHEELYGNVVQYAHGKPHGDRIDISHGESGNYPELGIQ